jgi:multidrug efflux pump subunit AcrA (membrane-fusion protein)
MKQSVFISLLAFLALVLGACSLMPEGQVGGRSSNEAPTPTPIPTSIVPMQPRYEVKRGEVVDELTFQGRISPVVEEELFFRANGVVRTVFAKRDDMIEEGMLIAEYEIAALERELASAMLDLERAESRKITAEIALAYDLEAAETNLDIAELELAQLRKSASPDASALAIQEERMKLIDIGLRRLAEGIDALLINDVKRAELQTDKLEAEIGEATISAPFAGQLLSISLTPGNSIEGYRTVATIADINELEISANLLSAQMEGLEEGMEVAISAVRRPGIVLEGNITQLPYPYGSGGNPSVTTVEDRDDMTHVTLVTPPEEADLELGDLVRVDVVRERKDDVLWLPPQALRNFDGRRFAVLEDDGSQRRVDVTVGIETQERVEIEEGLEEGQTVVGQ